MPLPSLEKTEGGKSGRFKVITKQKLPNVALMSAKPLEKLLPLKAEPSSLSDWKRAGMVKRHRRSVHREACRPQGVRSPQRQFSPVKSVDAGGDAVNVAEASSRASVRGEDARLLSGFEAVACMQRSDPELGRANGFPQGYGRPTNRRAHR